MRPGFPCRRYSPSGPTLSSLRFWPLWKEKMRINGNLFLVAPHELIKRRSFPLPCQVSAPQVPSLMLAGQRHDALKIGPPPSSAPFSRPWNLTPSSALPSEIDRICSEGKRFFSTSPLQLLTCPRRHYWQLGPRPRPSPSTLSIPASNFPHRARRRSSSSPNPPRTS